MLVVCVGICFLLIENVIDKIVYSIVFTQEPLSSKKSRGLYDYKFLISYRIFVQQQDKINVVEQYGVALELVGQLEQRI